jgi:cytochrome c5
VSKQDSQFFNIFSLVLGILIAIALVLFGVARAVGHNTQSQHVLADSLYVSEVQSRTAPLSKVAVSGQDNSALAIVASNPDAAAGSALPVPEDGTALYQAVCKTCHGAGIAGAPKSGDKAGWAPRIAQGTATLYKHAIEGYTGKAGVMPAKGGRVDLPDELIKLGVDHMIEINR